MKQFNLQEYLKNPDRHIVTRSGKDAKIICTDGSNKTYSIFALIQNEKGKDVLSYTNDGMTVKGYESPFDLFFASEKHERWVNLYKNGFGDYSLGRDIYISKERAEAVASSNCVSTVKIEWVE